MRSSSLRSIRKAKLTNEGERILQILQKEYQMEREAATRLMRDGGPMLAMALMTLTRGKL